MQTFETIKKTELNNDYTLREKWYKLNAIKNIGCCSYLYRKYDYPTDYEDFYNNYTADVTTNYSEVNGRSEEYLNYLSTTLGNYDGNRYSKEDYFNFIIKKIVCETVDGCSKEKDAKDLIESKGFDTKLPNPYEDTKLGVDLFVYKEGKLLCGLQVKPSGYFMGNNWDYLVKKRQFTVKQAKRFEREYKVPMLFFLYDKYSGNWVKNDKGTFSHRLKDLVNEDG